MLIKIETAKKITRQAVIDSGGTESEYLFNNYWEKIIKNLTDESNQVERVVNATLAKFYKLSCLTEDGYIEENGYYKTLEEAQKMKEEMDNYEMNVKYGIKQNIIECEFS